MLQLEYLSGAMRRLLQTDNLHILQQLLQRLQISEAVPGLNVLNRNRMLLEPADHCLLIFWGVCCPSVGVPMEYLLDTDLTLYREPDRVAGGKCIRGECNTNGSRTIWSGQEE